MGIDNHALSSAMNGYFSLDIFKPMLVGRAVGRAAASIVEYAEDYYPELFQSSIQAASSASLSEKVLSKLSGGNLALVGGAASAVALTYIGVSHLSKKTEENAPLSSDIEEHNVSKDFAESLTSEVEKGLSSCFQPTTNFDFVSDQEFEQFEAMLSGKATELLQSNLGFNIEEMIADAFSKQQELVNAEIQVLQDEIKKLQEGHSIFKKNLDPIQLEYQAKLKELKEIKDLETSPQVMAFYNGLHNFLSSKFFSAIVLKSGEIKREASKKEIAAATAAGYAAEGVTAFIGGLICVATFGAAVPLVALGTGAVAAAAGKAAEEAVGGRFTKRHEKCEAYRLKVAGNARDAMRLSELLARRITQKLFKKIKQFTPEIAAQKAKHAGDNIIRFIALDGLGKKQYSGIEDVIDDLIDEIDLSEKKKKKNRGRCAII